MLALDLVNTRDPYAADPERLARVADLERFLAEHDLEGPATARDLEACRALRRELRGAVAAGEAAEPPRAPRRHRRAAWPSRRPWSWTAATGCGWACGRGTGRRWSRRWRWPPSRAGPRPWRSTAREPACARAAPTRARTRSSTPRATARAATARRAAPQPAQRGAAPRPSARLTRRVHLLLQAPGGAAVLRAAALPAELAGSMRSKLQRSRVCPSVRSAPLDQDAVAVAARQQVHELRACRAVPADMPRAVPLVVGPQRRAALGRARRRGRRGRPAPRARRAPTRSATRRPAGARRRRHPTTCSRRPRRPRSGRTA